MGSEENFLYALGTGRYAEGWNPPIINGSISGKPWVDVYIKLDCSNYSVSDYIPNESSEYRPSVNITTIGNHTVLNWSAQEITPKDDFITILNPNKGDLDGDGQITTVDVLIVLQMVVNGEHNTNADMNNDHKVTSLDALMILQAAAGLIDLR